MSFNPKDIGKQPMPTIKELQEEGLPIDDKGRDMTHPMYGKRAWNSGLTNTNCGPKPGWRHTEESKERMKGRVAWNKGLKNCGTGGSYSHTEETKKVLSRKLKGNKNAVR